MAIEDGRLQAFCNGSGIRQPARFVLMHVGKMPPADRRVGVVWKRGYESGRGKTPVIARVPDASHRPEWQWSLTTRRAPAGISMSRGRRGVAFFGRGAELQVLVRQTRHIR